MSKSKTPWGLTKRREEKSFLRAAVDSRKGKLITNYQEVSR